MRKIMRAILVIALLVFSVPVVFAAGSAGWGGPDVVRAGDTITLTFYAGGGIYGGSGAVSYDSSVLTLQGYRQSIGGSWALEWGGNSFIFYDNSMTSPIGGSSAIFQATFTVNANAPVGAQVTVSATGVTLSDGQQDSGVGTVSYSRTVAEPLSGNCDLATMTVTGASVSPAFSPATTNYRASVPFGVSSLGITATAAHPGARVSVSNPGLTPGATTRLKVTVTAENGAQKVYSIDVFREQDPNYVPSNNADLESLTVAEFPLSPAFSSEVTQYYVWLPYETEGINISAVVADGKAGFSLGDSGALVPGGRTDIPVTVTAEDGTEKVYVITAIRAPEHDRVEDYLSGHLVPPETEPTEPPETEPATEPSTEPAPTTPESIDREPENIGYLLPCALCFVAGAAVAALVAILLRRKRKNL